MEFESVPARKPVEKKVAAAAVAGGGSAAVVTPFVVWLADELFWNGPAAPDVPLPVVGVIGLAVTGVSALVAGYWARHTARPDLPLALR